MHTGHRGQRAVSCPTMLQPTTWLQWTTCTRPARSACSSCKAQVRGPTNHFWHFLARHQAGLLLDVQVIVLQCSLLTICAAPCSCLRLLTRCLPRTLSACKTSLCPELQDQYAAPTYTNYGDGFCTDATQLGGNSNPTDFFVKLLSKEYLKQVILAPHVSLQTVLLTLFAFLSCGHKGHQLDRSLFSQLPQHAIPVFGSLTTVPVLLCVSQTWLHKSRQATQLSSRVPISL